MESVKLLSVPKGSLNELGVFRLNISDLLITVLARWLLLTGLLVLSACSPQPKISFFPLFSDHAVLQASNHVPVWGWAEPGEAVIVRLGSDAARTTATADETGCWHVVLDLQNAGPGPFELTAEGLHGRAVAEDVLVGEVWLCSGQSNMELPLQDTRDGVQEAARSENPKLRQFLVERTALTPAPSTFKGRWTVADPKNSGAFTAVGYYFGKEIEAEVHTPVGLVNASWGGTTVEAWTSTKGFNDPTLQQEAEKARDEHTNYAWLKASLQAWVEHMGRADHPCSDTAQYTEPVDEANADSDWKPVVLPGAFADAGLPDAGAVWLQRTVNVSQGGVGHGLDLFLGNIHGSIKAYWNGKYLGASECSEQNPQLHVRGAAVRTGANLLALRVFQPLSGAKITSGEKALFEVNQQNDILSLEGIWEGRAEFGLPALDSEHQPPAEPVLTYPPRQVASYLYDSMIAPLVPCAMRGVLWYQGEANAEQAWQYRTAFPSLINDWRARWGRGDFPFYFCQLAGYKASQAQPGESDWAELREAQTASLALPATGEAILIDAGEESDIHPKNKATPGERLARIALAKTYGQEQTVCCGPELTDWRADGNKVRLTFRHTNGGLVATPLPTTYRPASKLPETKPVVRHSPFSELEGFAVCGNDHVWKWATTAKIEGNEVVLTCAEVPWPVAVRYAWGNNPLCNLSNGAGLPAGPFRTDDFPATTLRAEY